MLMTERNEPLPILSQNNIQFPSDEKLSIRSFTIFKDFKDRQKWKKIQDGDPL